MQEGGATVHYLELVMRSDNASGAAAIVKRPQVRSYLVSSCLFIVKKHIKYLVANAILFDFLFHRLVLRRVHFIYRNFACGVAWWCGREVVWRLVCFGAAMM